MNLALLIKIESVSTQNILVNQFAKERKEKIRLSSNCEFDQKTMRATRSTSFMVSYRYYSSDILASDPIPTVDGLKTLQDAAKYTLAIHPTPGYGWAPGTPVEKWDLEVGRATTKIRAQNPPPFDSKNFFFENN